MELTFISKKAQKIKFKENAIACLSTLSNQWLGLSRQGNLIVAALCNCYRPSLHKKSNADCEIAQKMLKMASQENLVQKRVF